MRCSFAYQRRNRVVGSAGHHHRGGGLGTPQLVDLGQQRLHDRCGQPDRVVVGGDVPGRGVRKDKGAGAFRSGRGEKQRGRAGIVLAHDGGALRADLVQDRGQFLGVRLPTGAGGQAAAGRRHPCRAGQTRSACRTMPACGGTGRCRGPPNRCRGARSSRARAPSRVARCRAAGRRSGRLPAARTSSRAAPLPPPQSTPNDRTVS